MARNRAARWSGEAGLLRAAGNQIADEWASRAVRELLLDAAQLSEIGSRSTLRNLSSGQPQRPVDVCSTVGCG
jgi:hypothetical protein